MTADRVQRQRGAADVRDARGRPARRVRRSCPRARARAARRARHRAARRCPAATRSRTGSCSRRRARSPADRVVALPALEGPRVPGVPCDRDGFIDVDEHCAVRGAPGVYAVGDGTSQPVKQGGLATQQADAAAEAIARAYGAPCEAAPFRPAPARAAAHRHASVVVPRRARRAGRPRRPARRRCGGPGGKVAARYLTPYLAERSHVCPATAATLRDVDPPARRRQRRAPGRARDGADARRRRGRRGRAAARGALARRRRGHRGHAAARVRREAPPLVRRSANAPLIREPGGAWSAR